MYVVLIILTLICAVLLICVVLVQKSKGGALSSYFAEQQFHRKAHMGSCRCYLLARHTFHILYAESYQCQLFTSKRTRRYRTDCSR